MGGLTATGVPYSDNFTSQDAAESIDAASIRFRVFGVIAGQGLNGATCDEVEIALTLAHQTVSARFWELVRKQQIFPTWATRLTRSGRRARVYVTQANRPPMKTIVAQITAFGRVELKFGYDKDLISFVKSVSGFAFSKGPPALWWGPLHALHALQYAAQADGRFQVVTSAQLQVPPPLVDGGQPLRPFQVWGAQQLLASPSYLLAWSPRTGKSRAGLVAGMSGITARVIQRVIILGPASVLSGWTEQLRAVFPGLPYAEIWGRKNVLIGKPGASTEKELRDLRKQALALSGAAFVFCQHDLMAHRAKDLLWLADQGLYAVGCDEPQSFNNFEAPRSQTLMDLAQHPNARWRWGFSGTPMRNKSADLAVMFEFLGCPAPKRRPDEKKHKRSPWPYLIRYAGAHETIHDAGSGASHWEASDVETNPEELKAKLWSVAHRLTREEVAPWLPKAERTVILAKLGAGASAAYKALESRLGRGALAAVNGSDRLDALRTLAGSVLGPKLDTVVERLRYHADERGVKVVAGLMFHESLQKLCDLLGIGKTVSDARPGPIRSPIYVAAGWQSPETRQRYIDAWKATPGPAVLLCNTLANSVGLDLADAEVQVNGELAWVPSDALQWEARLHDVHQGKRVAPPLFEYVLAKGTIDEDMALAMLTKMGAIDRIVGGEREQHGLDAALRDSGLVNTVDLGLSDRSEVGVEVALAGLRARLMGEGAYRNTMHELTGVDPSPGALAGAMADAYEDEPEETSVDE